MTFGRTLRSLREARRIGLRRFARDVHLSATYISKIERDEMKPPADAALIRIAEALAIDRSILFDAADRVEPDVMEILDGRPDLWRLVRAVDGWTADEILAFAAEIRAL